ncbi:MAG: ADP-ribosylglycohydrolase family protein [Phycisphaeraceae bacterium]|nr:MAG: ADP-ribosylglycohydrolase family protein [Phycisphaeraceae bacterium]
MARAGVVAGLVAGWAAGWAGAVVAPAGVATADDGAVPRLIDREDYADRLRAMWLGQCIANWTGLRTEGRRINPPFYTDADWGQSPDGFLIDFVLNQNPWLADDDTDIEYVWVHALATQGGTALSGAQIASAWVEHVNRFIWVSNAKARALMSRGVTPPATGILTVNDQSLMIDAQLTTEVFGLLCPGMPDRALALADLPIRTTASGYAAHASQFFAVLYALAPVAPKDLTGAPRMRWLYDEARRWVPEGSKTAGIADFVLADFLANPDINDWERTRDAVYARYHGQAAANGFVYRGWYESSVNFAAGCIAMLYGQGDYRRTVQIATLSGWDSDNATATLGGLIGFMLGYDALVAQFPGRTFSDRFDILRTRDNLPDYLPGDAQAQDTLTLWAHRMLPIIDRQVAHAGGRSPTPNGPAAWLLPPPVRLGPGGDQLLHSPTRAEMDRSATMRVKRAGGVVTGSSSVVSSPPGGQGAVGNPVVLANGLEHDFTGREVLTSGERAFYSSQGASPPGGVVTLTVAYDRPVEVHTVRFIEGDHVSGGGWWVGVPEIEVRVGGVWVAPPGGVASHTALDPAVPFQILDFVLASPVQATGVRIRGVAGGALTFVTCAELDALSASETLPRSTFDLNGDGVVDVDDLHRFHTHPVDLDGDGAVTPADRRYLVNAVRWEEPESNAADRR